MVAVASSVSYSPSTLGLGELQREVLGFFQAPQDDPDLNNSARSAINRALDKVNGRTWVKLYGYQDITAVVDASDYALNLDFKDPMACLLLDSSGNQQARLPYLEVKSIDFEMPRIDGSGTPSHYTVFYDQSRVLSLSVPPDQGWVSTYATIRLRYHRRVPRLNGASDQHGLAPEFERFLIFDAASTLAMKLEPSRFQALAISAAQTWAALLRDDRNTMTDWSI